MNTDNNKISIRQIIVIFLISIASPIIRVLPRYTSEIAGSASWVMPIVGIIFFVIFLYILNSIVGKEKSKSLQDIFCDVFGNILGKILIVIYLIWSIILIALYLRNFADRMTSSNYVFTSNKFFMFTMLMLVYYTTRRELKFFARYIEFFILIFMVFFIGTLIISISDIKIVNLLPVTFSDSGNILLSTIPFLAVLSYITFMFFLGDSISDKQKFKSHFWKMSIAILFTAIMVIVLTVGSFGYNLTSELNLPFFAFFKNIKILDIIERIEAVLLTFWMVTDYAIITTFTYIAMKLFKKLFGLNSSKEIITPVLFIIYILSLAMASNLFEMSNLSKYFIIPFEMVVGMIIPIILFVVGKIRKKI